jgi:hypothetical protein
MEIIAIRGSEKTKPNKANFRDRQNEKGKMRINPEFLQRAI